jgi:EpsI family protein
MTTTFRTGTIVVIMSLTYAAIMWSGQRSPEELYQSLDTIPMEIDDWQGSSAEKLSQAEEDVLRASSYIKRNYDREDASNAGLFVAFYAMQRAGEAMHSPKHCLPGSGWEIWNYSETEVPFEDGVAVINKYYIQRGQDRLLVLYWYQSYDRIVASEYYAKICLVWDSVVAQRTSGSIVRITVADTPEGERQALDLASKMMPLVKSVLPRPLS